MQLRPQSSVSAANSPHKFAWNSGDPAEYHRRLQGKRIDGAACIGGMVEIAVGNASIVLSDGVGCRYHAPGEKPPAKHQLLLELDDPSHLSASVQMYGGIACFEDGVYDNNYYRIAREKPMPTTRAFDKAYFAELLSPPQLQKKSMKSVLATEQRIPGLGNGVLQDILLAAGMHPKRTLRTLTPADKSRLLTSTKNVLVDMVRKGGRDTEKDLFGEYGGYQTRLRRNTVGKPCDACGTPIRKEAYLGGSVYYCGTCQPLAAQAS